MKINRDLPRQIPRTPVEQELAAKIEAREAAEDQRKAKQAAEINLPIEEKS